MQMKKRPLVEAPRKSTTPPRDVVNGYTVPNGAAGKAVRFIVDYLTSYPGSPMSDVLQVATRFSGLNPGNATWLTSPSAKSPVDKLWRRVKERKAAVRTSFHLYLLPGTEVLAGTSGASPESMLTTGMKNLRQMQSLGLAPGDFVKYSEAYEPNHPFIGEIVGPDRETENAIKIKPAFPTSLTWEKHLKNGVSTQSIDFFFMNTRLVKIEQAEVEQHQEKRFNLLMQLKGASQANGEVDWRPDETLPEDYYAKESRSRCGSMLRELLSTMVAEVMCD